MVGTQMDGDDDDVSDPMITFIEQRARAIFEKPGQAVSASLFSNRLTLCTPSPRDDMIWAALKVRNLPEGGVKISASYGRQANFSMQAISTVVVATSVRSRSAPHTDRPTWFVRLQLQFGGGDSTQRLVIQVPPTAFYGVRAFAESLKGRCFPNGIPPLITDMRENQGNFTELLPDLIGALAARSPGGTVPIVTFFSEPGVHEPISGLSWRGKFVSYAGLEFATDTFQPLDGVEVEIGYNAKTQGPFYGAFAVGADAAHAAGVTALARLLKVVDASTTPSAKLTRLFVTLSLPVFLLVAQLRAQDGGDTAVPCLVGEPGVGKSLAQKTVLLMLGSKVMVNLTTATSAGIFKLLELQGEHSHFGGEELGVGGSGSNSKTPASGVTFDLVNSLYGAGGGKTHATGAAPISPKALFSSNTTDFAGPGASRAVSSMLNSRVYTLELRGRRPDEAVDEDMLAARNELTAQLALPVSVSYVPLVLPIVRTAALAVVAPGNQAELQALATRISNAANIAERLALAAAILVHAARSMLEHLDSADIPDVLVGLDFEALAVELCVEGVAANSMRALVRAAAPSRAVAGGGGDGGLSPTATAEALLGSYLDRLVPSIAIPSESAASVGAVGLVGDATSLAPASLVDVSNQLVLAPAQLTRKRDADAMAAATVASTFCADIIWAKSTKDVVFVNLTCLLISLSASDYDKKALQPAVAKWHLGQLVEYSPNMLKSFANKPTKVIAVRVAHLPAGSAFKLFAESSSSRFAAPAL